MIRAALILFLSLLTAADAGGQWTVSMTMPLGELDFRMFIAQDEGKLSGYVSYEVGEFPVKGTIDGDQVRLQWSIPEDGKTVPIAFTGTISGNAMSGAARIGNLGEGPMTATRIGSR